MRLMRRPVRFRYGNTVISRSPYALRIIVSWLLPGLDFISDEFLRPASGVAKERPLSIRILRGELGQKPTSSRACSIFRSDLKSRHR